MVGNPIYQYGLYFEHPQTAAGWQEIIAWQGSGTSAFDGGRQWAQMRRSFLSQDCSIIGYSRRRIDGTKSSNSFLFPNPIPGQFGEAQNIGSGKCNQPANTLEYEVYTANSANRRCFYFRGIDDSWITQGDITPFGDAQRTLIDAYLEWLAQSAASLRLQANPWQTIASIGNIGVTQGAPILVTSPNIGTGLTGNVVIYTRGLKNYPYLNGRWVGFAPDVNTVNLGTSSGRYNIQLGGVGYVRIGGVTVGSIVSPFNFARVGNRKTGLVFGVLRGKKSKKVIHR